MTRPSTLRLLAVAILASITMTSHAQAGNPTGPNIASSKSVQKPYKVLTNGKQVTIRSDKGIKSVMMWSASGHRIHEQKEVNASSYSFNITVNEKIFFVMVRLENGKLYTEKVGVN